MRHNTKFSSWLERTKKRTTKFLKRVGLSQKITKSVDGVKSFTGWSQLHLRNYYEQLKHYIATKKKELSKKWLKLKRSHRQKKRRRKERRQRLYTQISGRVRDFLNKPKIKFFISFGMTILGYGLLINYSLNYFIDTNLGIQPTIVYGILFYFIKFELTSLIKSIQKTPPKGGGGKQQ